MAENNQNQQNFVEQKPENAVDATMQEVGVETNAPIEPSTTENQEKTESVQEFKSKVQKKQQEVERNSGKKPTFTEAQHAVLMDLKKQSDKESATAEKLAEQQQQEEQKKIEQMNNALNQYEESKAFAQEKGIPFQEDKEFESALQQRQQQANLERPATEVDVQTAQTPTVEQVKKASEPIQQAAALEEAQDQVQRAKIQAVAERQKALQEQILQEDEQMKNINPSNFWEKKSTGDKILAGIGLVLAGMGAGATGQPNAALQVIQNAIDNDIKAQKLNAEQSLAKKKHALSLVELQLKKLDSATNNKLKKVQIQKMIQDMQTSQLQLQQSRLMAKKLTSTDGLTREEVFALDPKMQEKMVMLSDGKFRPAVSAQLAKKLNQETIPQAKDAIRGLTRLKEIMTLPAAEVRPSLRAEAATIKQALKGSLRLELFGPGVMTDFESKMADKIIGDPTKILTLDSVEKAKFNALLKKVKQGTIDKIRQSGVDIPKTKNEKILDQFMSKNKKISRPEAINALIKLGYWDESADVGF